MRSGRANLAGYLGAALVLCCPHAFAQAEPALLNPVAIAGETAQQDPGLALLAEQLNEILKESARDLGLSATVQATPISEARPPSKELADWWLFGQLTRTKDRVLLRLHAVRPRSRVLLTREEFITRSDLEMKAVTMLRDLVKSDTGEPTRRPDSPTPERYKLEAETPRSHGRAILALNTAFLGGYLGYATQRASGSSDARLQYPLTALGAGLGLGASMLVADEWDISAGRAWFLSAGILWPGASGFLLAEAYDDEPNNRYLYGLGGAVVGLTLATTTVGLTEVDSGRAALAHSGGLFGTALGGLTEAAILAKLEEAPTRGMGFGAGAGAIVAGALSTQVNTSATRVLFVDLSASLGALTGAALATPLLFVGDEVSDGRSRAWFLSVLGGTVLGAATGLLMTSEPVEETRPTTGSWLGERALPYAGLVGVSSSGDGVVKPVWGAGLRGTW
jgi:hypothetical protein